MNKTLNVLHQTVLFLVFLPFALLAENHINLKNGEEVYIERCVLCHGKNGEGWDWEKKAVKPPVPVPNLLKVLPKRTDEYLATVIKFGGNAVGLTDFMPALGFNLTDRDVSNLIAYLRGLKLKTAVDGAFFEKQVPLFDKLVWLPKKSGSLLHHQHNLVVPAEFFRPITVSFSEKNNRQNRFFQPNFQLGFNLLAKIDILNKNSGNHSTGGFFPHAINIDDFNHDGNLDFAIPASASRTLTILLGDGTGGIISNQQYPVGEGPTWVETADFNRDGNLDFITTNAGAGSLSLYFGDGKGGLFGRREIKGIHGPPSLVAEDFNQDGLPDLAVVQAGFSKVVILINDSTGIPKVSYSFDVERGPHIIDGVDLNQDKITDLVVGSLGSHTLSIILANGNGTFKEANVVKVGRFPHYRAYGDWNGDGHVDAL
ncbi:MAG: hypothetical protein Ct9H300mP4_14440 [Gammaproteobacteria bacterium]|nr:MAG: hypothetical protein Ct9H300mP4_14440 [Gammaproteobacteria bacterium]